MNASREEERVCMTHNSIIILSGNESDSGRREITFRPVTSFNKASTFTDEHKSDNEETPLGKTHQVPFTQKQQALERTKRLNINCGFLDAENLFILTKTWSEYLQYEEVDVDIQEILYNANCTPVYFFVEKDFESWDPKIHSPRNYLQSFYVAALIDKCGTNNHYPLAMIRNGISILTRSYYKVTMIDLTPLLSSDSEMASKTNRSFKISFVKNCHATFDNKMKFNLSCS